MLGKALLFRLPAKDRAIVPSVVYTDPELARAGLTEAQASKRHRKLTILRWPFAENEPARSRAADGRPYQAGRGQERRHTRRHNRRRKRLRTHRHLDACPVARARPQGYGVVHTAPLPHWAKLAKAPQSPILQQETHRPLTARHRAPAAIFRLRRSTAAAEGIVWHERENSAVILSRLPGRPSRTVPLARGLSIKLLVLTVLFVMIAEVLIFLPSIANFQLRWLEERLGTAAARFASCWSQEDLRTACRGTLQDDVLMAIGAKAIAVRDGGVSRLLVIAEMPPEVDEHIDLAHTGRSTAHVGRARHAVLRRQQDAARLRQGRRERHSSSSSIIPDNRLRAAMLVYSRNVALLSLVISLFTATLVLCSHRPHHDPADPGDDEARCSTSRAAPDDPGRIIRAGGPRRTRSASPSANSATCSGACKRRSASRSISPTSAWRSPKINHDMRNILASGAVALRPAAAG